VVQVQLNPGVSTREPVSSEKLCPGPSRKDRKEALFLCLFCSAEALKDWMLASPHFGEGLQTHPESPEALSCWHIKPSTTIS
jgi:hypothetical protein